jgi:hypothetical protein
MNARSAAVLAAILFASSASGLALAQQAPAPAPTASANSAPSLPPGLAQDAINAVGNLVKGVFGWNDNESIGAVTFYRGYDLQVRQQLNRYRDIHLHKGTVINPRGWTLRPGDQIDIRGHGNSDGSLNADIITVLNK